MKQNIVGTVSYKRVIRDNSHGKVQAERVLPVFVQGEPTPQAIQDATAAAWAAVVAQVNETINSAFEREGKPAPCYDGPRYHVARWTPQDSVLLIIPQGARPPGGHRSHYIGGARRLDNARQIAAGILEHSHSALELLDLSDGDFTELQTRLQALRQVAAQLNHDGQEAPDDDAF